MAGNQLMAQALAEEGINTPWAQQILAEHRAKQPGLMDLLMAVGNILGTTESPPGMPYSTTVQSDVGPNLLQQVQQAIEEMGKPIPGMPFSTAVAPKPEQQPNQVQQQQLSTAIEGTSDQGVTPTTTPSGTPPVTRDFKEGEPGAQKPPTQPSAGQAPGTPQVPGQAPGTPQEDFSSLLRFMSPESYNKQVDAIIKMRPETIEQLVGRAFPDETKTGGGPLKRAIIDFFYGLAGAAGGGETAAQLHARRQAQMERKWTMDAEWAKANLDQQQQLAFLKLNREVQLDEQRRAATGAWLAKQAELNPDNLENPNWHSAFATVNRIPQEYVQEWVNSHRDPKTGKVTGLYMTESERLVKNIKAKATVIKTVFPEMEDEEVKLRAIEQYPKTAEEMKTHLANRFLAAQKRGDATAAQAAYKTLQEYTRLNSTLMSKQGEVTDFVSNLVAGGVLTPEQGKDYLQKAMKEILMPETVKSEAKAAGELKPGDLIKQEQLNALKTARMQVAQKLFPHYAGQPQELARSLEMIESIIAKGPQTNDDKIMLAQYQSKLIDYLRDKGRTALILKLKQEYGNNIPIQKWVEIADKVGSGYSDAAILAKPRSTAVFPVQEAKVK